jgi:trans-aconitate methyltransferase
MSQVRHPFFTPPLSPSQMAALLLPSLSGPPPVLRLEAHARLRRYASDSAEYQRAFGRFLAKTDQKSALLKTLASKVASLPRRQIFIDVGAGTGALTSRLAPAFGRTIAIEPNPHFQRELATLPQKLEVVPLSLLDCEPLPRADFILCSHVLHYIDPSEWARVVARLTESLAPNGLLAIVLQNRHSASMRLLDHYAGERPFLDDLMGSLQSILPRGMHGRLETIPSSIACGSLEATLEIVEFLLNVVHLKELPLKTSVVDYLAQNLVPCAERGFSLSCDQDVLLIGR